MFRGAVAPSVLYYCASPLVDVQVINAFTAVLCAGSVKNPSAFPKMKLSSAVQMCQKMVFDGRFIREVYGTAPEGNKLLTYLLQEGKQAAVHNQELAEDHALQRRVQLPTNIIDMTNGVSKWMALSNQMQIRALLKQKFNKLAINTFQDIDMQDYQSSVDKLMELADQKHHAEGVLRKRMSFVDLDEREINA